MGVKYPTCISEDSPCRKLEIVGISTRFRTNRHVQPTPPVGCMRGKDMSSSPLSYNAEEETYTLELRYGPHAGTTFSVKLTMCQSPACQCTDITFSCSPLAELPVFALPPLTFSLDIEERCVKQRDEYSLSSQALSLADGLIAEMSEENWNDLCRHFYTYKEMKSEEVDCATLYAPFPPETMMDPSLMVGYKDILPFAKAFPFMLGTARWLVDEQYCINPDCACRDVFFEFLRIDLPLEGNACVAQQLTATYDSHRDIFKPLTTPWPETPVLETLTKALRKAHPNLAAEIRKRRTTLRTLYQKARTREHRDASTSAGPTRKAGPNDPCLCGSGKKYKKCCGRVT